MTADRPLQTVVAVNGFAYGMIGADLHIFLGSGVPLYLLARWRPPEPADRGWLRQLPSRMLDARAAIVSFTGRGGELAELRRWRDGDPPLALRWLYGPGGQGKTRLADRLAAESVQAGWKVIVASLGTDAHRAEGGPHDLSVDGAAGVLLLVDYGDGWPATSLAWLLANAILSRPGVPARVLVLARTDAAFPAVSARLHGLRVDMSRQPLGPLPGTGSARVDMFTAARDRFADLYGVPHASTVSSPVPLEQPELGLTLTLHMAALVAVDAAATGARPPSDGAALTVYLLNREYLHWERLHGDHDHELRPAERVYRTAPEQMRRAVFVAALTGPLPTAAATALLERLELPDSVVLATDHAVCYPPAEPQRTLEPVYPDRLAEDFLALSLPGHRADHPVDPWTGGAVRTLLARDPEHGRPPQWTARTLTFLLAAAQRWPHVGPSHLYPLLRADPGLAAGSGGVLSLLAATPDAPIPLLTAVVGQVPDRDYAGLAVGRAALVERLTAHQLARRPGRRRRAVLLESLSRALGNAGRLAEARAAGEEAVDLWRRLLHRYAIVHKLRRNISDREWSYRGELALAQLTLAFSLTRLNHDEGALAAVQDAVDYYRAIREHKGASVYETEYAFALNNLARCLAKVGRVEQARAASEEAVQRRRGWAAGYPAAPVQPDLAKLLGDSVSDRQRLWELSIVDPIGPQAGLASVLAEQGHQRAEAGDLPGGFESLNEALQIYIELGRTDYARYEDDIANCLGSMSTMLAGLGHFERARTCSELAVEHYRALARANPARHRVALAHALGGLSHRHVRFGDLDQAVQTAQEALGLFADAGLDTSDIAAFRCDTLDTLATALRDLGRSGEAVTAARQSVALRQRLRATRPGGELAAAGALTTLADMLADADADADADAEAWALDIGQQGVAVYRSLSSSEPAVRKPILASALYAFGLVCTQIHEYEHALAATQECVDLRRELAAADPARHLADLATALGGLAVDLSNMDRKPQALAARIEQVDLLRRLAAAEPGRHDADLAEALMYSAARYQEETENQAAIAAAEEAAARYRSLANHDRTAHQTGLARAMQTLGACYALSARYEEGLAATEEAIELLGPLVTADPGQHSSWITSAQANRTVLPTQLGRTPSVHTEGRQRK